MALGATKKQPRRRWAITRRQRPIPGGRDALPACVIKSIKAHVEAHAEDVGCSKSFVVAWVLAKYYNIGEQEDLEQPAPAATAAKK